ncbi:hypothetical protein D3C86_1728230 [compost metagenome]
MSKLDNKPESNQMAPCRNQATGMLSESTGKGIDAVIVSRVTQFTKLRPNRKRLVKSAYCLVSSLYAQ